MKNIKFISSRSISRLTFVLLVLLAFACKKDETYGPFNTAALDTVIAEAQALVSNSAEGTSPGDFKPGSIKELQSVIDWAVWQKNNAKEQEDIADAVERVNEYIAKFNSNIVSLAIPWIHQEPGTYIEIEDNTAGDGVAGRMKEITKQPFTLEAKFYILNLKQRGYSNTFFSNVMGEGGANDRGFDIRYFNDGVVHVNVGGGNGWKEVVSAPGTIKAGQWIHVSYVNNITSHKLYIDGVEVLSSNNTYADSDVDYPFAIGNTIPWDDRTCNAMVQDIRVWTEARTAAQINETLESVTGEEAKLEISIPLNADLGNEVVSVNNKFKASLVGNITWVADGIPPVIVLDYTKINAAKSAVVAMGTLTEGTNNGDYPVGTNAFLQSLVAQADEVIATAIRQDQLDSKAEEINAKLALVKKYTVADADGIFVDLNDPNAIGLRITPNYTPQGDYTVEFQVKVKTLFGYGTGEFFNNGNYGVWVYGYKNLTEEEILKSGGLWNFTDAGAGWQGPKTSPLVITPGNWQHVAIVHDNSARTTKLFVDGIQRAVQEDIGAPNVSGWGEMWLGNGWGKMYGSIKNFRLWNEARSASDLNGNISGTESNLEVYLPLNRVAGVSFSDVTGDYNAELRGIKWNLE